MAPPFDTSQVSPTDAAVTLRSLRRRFASALRAGADGALLPADARWRRPAPGGLSPVEHAAWTAAAIRTLHLALRRVEVETDPEVDLPPVDVDLPVTGGDAGPEATVAQLGDEAEAMAATIANIHGVDWSRTGRSRGGPVTALDVARLAVRIAIEHLRAAEAATAQVAGEGG